MNEEQTKIVLNGMVELIRKVTVAVNNHQARIGALEHDVTQQNLAAFLALMPLVDALSAQINDVVPPII